MILLDSDVFIWLLRGKKEIVKIIEGLKKNEISSLSTITIAETYKNIFPFEIQMTDEMIYENIIYPVDDTIAKLGGLYWQEFTKARKNLSLTDCLIAATAKLNNLTLITLNTKHFPMKEIRVYSPFGFN